jgi:hypothetical protein
MLASQGYQLSNDLQVGMDISFSFGSILAEKHWNLPPANSTRAWYLIK